MPPVAEAVSITLPPAHTIGWLVVSDTVGLGLILTENILDFEVQPFDVAVTSKPIVPAPKTVNAGT